MPANLHLSSLVDSYNIYYDGQILLVEKIMHFLGIKLTSISAFGRNFHNIVLGHVSDLREYFCGALCIKLAGGRSNSGLFQHAAHETLYYQTEKEKTFITVGAISRCPRSNIKVPVAGQGSHIKSVSAKESVKGDQF